MKRIWIACFVALLLSGCGSRTIPPTPPAAAPASLPVVIVPWSATPGLLPAEQQPLTIDVPTYTADSDYQQYQMPGPGIAPPQGRDGNVDPTAVLGQVAAGIAASGKPDVPAGVAASLVGVMEGNRYVYLLGGIPTQGEDSAFVYMLEQQNAKWQATPICNHAWRWVWPGTLAQQSNPVVICATVEGSGAVMTLKAYKAGQQVLWATGLEESGLRVLPKDDQPPVIVAYGTQRWLNHKMEPQVMERHTFTWDGHAYVEQYERLADWRYHLARFVLFVAQGMPEKAAAEMATPNAELPAYLASHAPDLKVELPNTLATQGHYSAPNGKAERAWLHRAGADLAPWFWFDFDENGKITAVGQQVEEPK